MNELEQLKLKAIRLRDALQRIEGFPIHSEPIGDAYVMQQIAHDALVENAKVKE